MELVNGPVKRWHEVNHLQPPVDSKRCLVMVPSTLHLLGHTCLFFSFFFNAVFIYLFIFFKNTNYNGFVCTELGCEDRLHHKPSLCSMSYKVSVLRGGGGGSQSIQKPATSQTH